MSSARQSRCYSAAARLQSDQPPPVLFEPQASPVAPDDFEELNLGEAYVPLPQIVLVAPISKKPRPMTAALSVRFPATVSPNSVSSSEKSAAVVASSVRFPASVSSKSVSPSDKNRIATPQKTQLLSYRPVSVSPGHNQASSFFSGSSSVSINGTLSLSRQLTSAGRDVSAPTSSEPSRVKFPTLK